MKRLYYFYYICNVLFNKYVMDDAAIADIFSSRILRVYIFNLTYIKCDTEISNNATCNPKGEHRKCN